MSETALITGASAGIGKELARLFAAAGSDLILVARRTSELETLATELRDEHGIAADVLTADLADPEAPARIHAQLHASGRAVDVVVNNAGFGAGGSIAALSLERQLAMIQVNLTSLTHLTRLFLPDMLDRNRGGVLNVASTAAFQPGPYLAIYYATKAYVLSFTEALAEELAGTGVCATCLAPGATKTEFFERADMEDSLLVKLGTMNATTVARAGYRGFRRRRVLVIPGFVNKLGAFAVRFVPRFVVRKITARLDRPVS